MEREDFSWVASLKKIDPSAGDINPDVLSPVPPKALIAARIRLKSGKFFAYRLAPVGGKVRPIHFLPLNGKGKATPYAQALATWVAADIEVPGTSVEVVEETFGEAGGDVKRSMTLSPRRGLVEIAVLNLPPLQPPQPPQPASPGIQDPPGPGGHFERYFDLLKNPPPQRERLVPQARAGKSIDSEPEVDWEVLHQCLASELLDKIRLGIGRTTYDQVLCPTVQWP